jgi:TonB family protein
MSKSTDKLYREALVDKAQTNKNYFLYIVIAIVFIHAISLFKEIDLSVSDFKSDDEQQIIIKLVNPNLQTEKAIVKTRKGRKKAIEDAFRGKDDNFVHRQTVASQSGATKDAGLGKKEGVDKKTKLKEQQVVKTKQRTTLSNLSLTKTKKAKRKKKATTRNQIAKGLNRGNKALSGSAKSSQSLDDIPLGDFNQLNTSKFKNYSYNMRVRDRIEQLWFRAINSAVGNISTKGRYLASEIHQTTLKIVLNAKGKILDVNVMGASGVKEFDESAIKSFNEAVAFPNPPKDMIKNGQVTLNWSFNVDASR